jgi:hypothetical protein
MNKLIADYLVFIMKYVGHISFKDNPYYPKDLV